MGMNYVIDTNVILYFLGGKLADPLPDDGQISVSVISEIELLSYPSLTVKEEKLIKEFLSDIDVVNLTEDVKNKAIQLRRKYAVKLPDAIIASTALIYQAEFITNDKRLAKISHLKSKEVRLK